MQKGALGKEQQFSQEVKTKYNDIIYENAMIKFTTLYVNFIIIFKLQKRILLLV